MFGFEVHYINFKVQCMIISSHIKDMTLNLTTKLVNY